MHIAMARATAEVRFVHISDGERMDRYTKYVHQRTRSISLLREHVGWLAKADVCKEVVAGLRDANCSGANLEYG